MKRHILAFVLSSHITVVLAGSSAPVDQPAAVLIEWNRAVFEIAEKEDGFLTLKGLRTATMAHLAMHDVLSQILGHFTPYGEVESIAGADPVAAATQAAYAVVTSQYPDQDESLRALNERWLATVKDRPAKAAALRAGNSNAQAIAKQRQGDGWDAQPEYRWHPMAPGVYAEFEEHSGTPKGFIFGAGWGKATGFVLMQPEQFRSPPPPDVTSAAYARAYDEVRELGRLDSKHRTADQTHLALWWKDFAENSHNRLARNLIARENLSLHESARLFALLNMSIFDAYISSFNNKFFYNHWRPYTAIRWAANDDNPATEAEPAWTNTHRHTYAFPSYPSAHGTACAAAMTAFSEVFGDDYEFSMHTPQVDIAGPFSGKMPMDPPTRHFSSFNEAAQECALSRIYLGIHFRYDSTEGNRLGRQVGENVIKHTLLPAEIGVGARRR